MVSGRVGGLFFLQQAMLTKRSQVKSLLTIPRSSSSSDGNASTTNMPLGPSSESSLNMRSVSTQRDRTMRAIQKYEEGLEKLTTAGDALGLSKSLLQQARDLASTANGPSANRAWIAAEVNDLLGQAKDVLQTATYAGRRLFLGYDSKIQIQAGSEVVGSFEVKLAGTSTTTTANISQPLKQWTRISGSTKSDWASYLAAANDGSIYAVGTTTGNLNGSTNSYTGTDSFRAMDAGIAKFNADGTMAWSQQFGTNDSDALEAVGVSSDGSVFVSGRTWGNLDGQTNLGEADFFVTKFSSDGTKQWSRLLGTAGIDDGQALAVGTDGSLYMVGKTSGYMGTNSGQNMGDLDAVLVKFNSDGTRAWARQFGGDGWDGADFLAISNDGSIITAGTTASTVVNGNFGSGGKDALISKYDSNGNVVWTKRFGSSGEERVLGIVANKGDGSFFVTGLTNGNLDGQTNNGGNDGFITKFDASGNKVWTKLYGTPSDDSFAGGVIHDGDLYLSGSTEGDFNGQTKSGTSDALLARFSTDGVMKWSTLVGTTGSGESERATSVVSSNGSLYLGGTLMGSLDGQTYNGLGDAFIQKFSTSRSSTSTATLSGLVVDLSTESSTTSALADIDSVLYYWNTVSTNVSRGIKRANLSINYLSNSLNILDTRLERRSSRF
jgi:hypothetical protein